MQATEFRTTAYPKSVAKSLQGALVDDGHDVPLAIAQKLVAKALGHASWYALETACGPQVATEIDPDFKRDVRRALAAEVRRLLAEDRRSFTNEGVDRVVAAAVTSGQRMDESDHGLMTLMAKVLNEIKPGSWTGDVVPFDRACAMFRAMKLATMCFRGDGEAEKDRLAGALLAGLRETEAYVDGCVRVVGRDLPPQFTESARDDQREPGRPDMARRGRFILGMIKEDLENGPLAVADRFYAGKKVPDSRRRLRQAILDYLDDERAEPSVRRHVESCNWHVDPDNAYHPFFG